ncbi:large-conductance mechanosensitive channel protein MscL [Aminipila luticellarii]|uniref:Large-conductance mechanosensitive channel n=1 Tax=Aminipila luticellarii TaxID=2507160 RepID=A0A410PT46_9FIRM|nr:large-conductance mechanosensitive channel protein MscL [Aminipila luticellarii]QAT42151.1 large-conductance mechanosensitive channel protein MscL [Aminipila luticellarii]
MNEKKGFITEFKEFISRGSVIDLAVGVIIGSAFTAIVTSLVNDIVMPIIGCILNGINFTDLKYVITPAAKDTAEAAIYYGNFIQSVVNFLLIALVIFMVIKGINTFHKKEEAQAEEPKPAEPSEDVVLLREIRDLLQEKKQL